MVDDLSTLLEFHGVTHRVLICDDEPDVARTWLEDIRRAIPADRYVLEAVPSNEAIKEAIQVLLHRRNAMHEGHALPREDCIFDDADILVLDYDLLHVDDNNTRYTGEGVARLARVFSRCSIIVVLNQYLGAHFDLGLRGHLESFADLNLDADLLRHEGLWREGPWEGFRPWHWPVLSAAVDGFHRRVSWLSESDRLNTPIVEILDLNEPNAGRLSDTAFGFLAPKAIGFEALARTTFADFVRGKSAAVNARDGEMVLKHDPAAAARIAASRIFKWLEREVLGPQDVLVDIPHLLQRAPYLVVGDIRDQSVWNAAVSGDRSVVSHLVPSDAWFAAGDWLSRPAVWWEKLEKSPEVREARAKFDFGVAPDLVFLEDASRFGRLDDATEFRAGFHNAFDRRYAAKFDDVTYAPQRRFAFGS